MTAAKFSAISRSTSLTDSGQPTDYTVHKCARQQATMQLETSITFTQVTQ